MLQSKRNVEATITIGFADDEDFVGARLERIFDGADCLPGRIQRGQPNQVGHVELAFFRRVELGTVETKLFALQSVRVFPVSYPFHIHEEPFGRLPYRGDTASFSREHRLKTLPQMLTGSYSAHPQGATNSVPRNNDPDLDRVREPGTRAVVAR